MKRSAFIWTPVLLCAILLSCQPPGIPGAMGDATPTPDMYMTAAAGAQTRNAIALETSVAQFPGPTEASPSVTNVPPQGLAPTLAPTQAPLPSATAEPSPSTPTFTPLPSPVPALNSSPTAPATISPTTFPATPFPRSLPAEVSSGTHGIVNFHTQKCVEAPADPNANNTSVLQAACSGAKTQAWSLVPTGDGYYEIISQNSNKCLDVEFKHAAMNYDLVQSTCNGDKSQRWRFSLGGSYNDILARSNAIEHSAPPIEAGAYYQVIAQHSGMCVDLDGWSHEDSAHIIHYPCAAANNDNQLWALK